MSLMVRIRERSFDELVARRNFSMKGLAEKLGVSDTYLSNVKNRKWDQFKPGPELRQKMLDVLGCEFDDIFEIVNGNETGPKPRRKSTTGKKAAKKKTKKR